ncbi:MAG: hypothetical protein ACRDR6_05285 [Pseudonocardiaceae bacterium]
MWQLARRLEREAAWAEKEKCQRALALRLRHQLPVERVAVPITRGTVSYPAQVTQDSPIRGACFVGAAWITNR